MKSVGNLTDFVRSHMLEPFEVAPRIQALIGHFDDLSHAHQAVLRQVELLTPLVADSKRHAALTNEVERVAPLPRQPAHLLRRPEARSAR